MGGDLDWVAKMGHPCPAYLNQDDQGEVEIEVGGEGGGGGGEAVVAHGGDQPVEEHHHRADEDGKGVEEVEGRGAGNIHLDPEYILGLETFGHLTWGVMSSSGSFLLLVSAAFWSTFFTSPIFSFAAKLNMKA